MPSLALAPVVQRQPLSVRTSSLRLEVARWFVSVSPARVTRFGRIYLGGSRYVCVSAYKNGGRFALYFFHHGPDDWRIYPPMGMGPSLVYWSVGVEAPSANLTVG